MGYSRAYLTSVWKPSHNDKSKRTTTNLENLVKSVFKITPTKISGFIREAVSTEDFDKLVEFVENFNAANNNEQIPYAEPC